jgi:hypothetical protein
MVTPATPGARPNPTAPATEADWTVHIADTIDSVIDSVRNKTVVLETIARGIVYGVLIAVVGTATLILATIALVRVLTAIPGVEVWMIYGVLGTIFTLAGLVCWRKRRPKPSAS